jgi:predicted RecA/RadA family phage recombinase
MGTTFRQKGDILTHANASGADIAVDEVVVIGDSVAVALVAIADTESGSVSVSGVHLLAKRTGQAWVQGDKLDWDVSESEFGKDIVAYSGDVIGCAIAAKDAASADATGEVLLANPGAAEA